MDSAALAALRQLLLFAALLSPLELLWPAQPAQRLLRRGLATDLGWAALQPFAVGATAAALLAALATGLTAAVPAAWSAALASQPWGLQLAEILIFGEVSGYLYHRAAHASPLLWRLHAVHHSSRELDWLSGHRQHPLESVILLALANLPAVALGFDSGAVVGVILLQKLHTAFVHANVALPEGRWERWLSGPRFHRWHHERDRDARNFASLLPGLDRLFGSFDLPEGEPEALGVREAVPDGLLGQLLYPLHGLRHAVAWPWRSSCSTVSPTASTSPSPGS